jgi:hypothetical protein
VKPKGIDVERKTERSKRQLRAESKGAIGAKDTARSSLSAVSGSIQISIQISRSDRP